MVRRLLEGVAEAEEHRLGEGASEELETHREAVVREPGGYRQRRERRERAQRAVVAESVAVGRGGVRLHILGDQVRGMVEGGVDEGVEIVFGHRRDDVLPHLVARQEVFQVAGVAGRLPEEVGHAGGPPRIHAAGKEDRRERAVRRIAEFGEVLVRHFFRLVGIGAEDGRHALDPRDLDIHHLRPQVAERPERRLDPGAYLPEAFR